MNRMGKWGEYAVELMEGDDPATWNFVPDSEPWLCPDESGLQVSVTDWSLNAAGDWDYIVVALRLEDTLPDLLRAHIEEPEDVEKAIASAESLERMASAIRARVAEIMGTTAPQPASERA